MNSDLLQTELGKVMTFQRGYDLTHRQMSNGKFPVVGSSEIIGYHDKYKKTAPALLIGRSGTVGRPQFYNQDIWPHNTTLFVTDFHGNDPKYCYYLLKALNLEDYANSSGVPTLNRNFIHPLKISVHDKTKQPNVSKILSTLDDKIALNSKANAKLEQTARLIYDYWFTQFDFPYEKDKPYKSSGGKMVYSTKLKREIPESWNIKPLKQIAKVIMGQSPKGASYNENQDGVPLLNGPADYENGSLVGQTFTSEPTRLCAKNDLVFCVRATIGNLTYAEKEFCLGRGVAAIRVNDSKMSELIYYAILQEIERFKVQAGGSIIVGITKDDLTDSNILLPDEGLLSRFHSCIRPVFDKIRTNKTENLELVRLRDWLLPMLMTGQVRVRD